LRTSAASGRSFILPKLHGRHRQGEAGMPLVQPQLRELYVSHSVALLAYARHRTSDAEDAVADTFVKAFRSMPPDLVGHDHSERAWLFTVLRNTIISAERRRQTVERSRHLVLDRRDARAPDEPSPELEVALRLLPEGQRSVLELRFIADLDVVAVAEVLGLSQAATRALTYRALRRLRVLMLVPDLSEAISIDDERDYSKERSTT
jgi:RNA polymerase sigma factor (sigma-70 family)